MKNNTCRAILPFWFSVGEKTQQKQYINREGTKEVGPKNLKFRGQKYLLIQVSAQQELLK